MAIVRSGGGDMLVMLWFGGGLVAMCAGAVSVMYECISEGMNE